MFSHTFMLRFDIECLEKRLNKHMDKDSEWIKHMQQMSKRYETNKSCKTARTKWTFKQGVEQKQIYILQQ